MSDDARLGDGTYQRSADQVTARELARKLRVIHADTPERPLPAWVEAHRD